MRTDGNSAINLLTQPRLRVARHIFLLMLVLSFSTGSIWHMAENGQIPHNNGIYLGLAVFASSFLGGIYLNIYILTPKLLLKNKWGKYFGWLSALVLFMLVIVCLFQIYNHERELQTALVRGGYFMLFVNIISALFCFLLLFLGTTTLVLFKHWILETEQSKELESATIEMELKFLENQINPHFLFNMLNNANIMIKKDADMAVHIIRKLEDMLRYLMNESKEKAVYLKDEILFLNDYLELEKLRRDDFEYSVNVTGKPIDIQIPPLLFITFVENAIKHNVDSRAASYIHLFFETDAHSLLFMCENSIPAIPPSRKRGGIGLSNITRRLELLYNKSYTLKQEKTTHTYRVTLTLKQ